MSLTCWWIGSQTVIGASSTEVEEWDAMQVALTASDSVRW